MIVKAILGVVTVLLIIFIYPLSFFARYWLGGWWRKNRDLPFAGHSTIFKLLEPNGYESIRQLFVKQDNRWPKLINLGASFDGGVAIGVTSADGLRQVLLDVDTFPKAKSLYSLLEVFLGHGLATSSGEIWKTQRQLLTPMFHLQKLRSYFQLMNEEAATLVQTFQATNSQPGYLMLRSMRLKLIQGTITTVDCVPMFATGTLRIILRAVFGGRLNTDFMVHEWRELIDNMTAFTQAAIFFPLWSLPYVPIPAVRRFFASLGRINSALTQTVALARSETNADNDDLVGSMVSLVDEATKQPLIADELIVDECKTFLFAGQETTSNALAWTMYFLVQHPEIQDQLRTSTLPKLEEHNRVLAESRGVVDETNWAELKLTNAVVSEALRLQPPVPSLERDVARDVEIEGHKIAKGSLVSMMFWAPQVDAAHWDEPLVFRPQRWLADHDSRHPFAYTPFSAGPRNCIGQKLSKQESIIILTYIIKQFRIVCDDIPTMLKTVKANFRGTMAPENFKCRFVPRS